ncbi:hypothetical protein [Pantoea agglomerans]|uniref:Uncharacterized protein n=1 Tax=Enterobacter agglomerans TaxID=549 RepID=A0ACC5PZB6_ENTAG|nr:hypothetical protein [Pantoea agglomerans]MBD8129265.1 hypothetical protein [Pantoea agglomerans]MBD8156464.1 hypothetical protein [Pantoea agglomerans]MBD8234859.1 hypothetical protein [Pantoea agglomerans]MBD8245272.1 hypothetical protein [Pantoea agglomerans]WVL83566.1 hypothetical protein IFU02_003160 [Pantoea agglomerans]
MSKIDSITVPQCKCSLSEGKISFDSVITCDKNSYPDSVDYYFISPADGAEIIFYQMEPSLKKNGKVIASYSIQVSGDQNTANILSLVKKYGMRTYTITVKPTIAGDDEWDGTKTITTQNIQFTDVTASVSPVADDSSDGEVKINVKCLWWNNDCMVLTAKSSASEKELHFTLSWDEPAQAWTGNTIISLKGAGCNNQVTITLTGMYSSACQALPCTAWDYSYTFDKKFTGACMKTKYQDGLHILKDIAGDDLGCSLVHSAKSGHMIATYTSTRNSTSYRSVYIRVVSAKGALTPEILAPDVTDNDQYDADVAPVADTDDFVVVWTSNASGNARRIYARRFTINSSGEPAASGTAIQISQSNGDYVAPRIVYNKSIDKFFITWISVVDKEIQSIYLNNDSSMSEAGYQGGVAAGAINAGYYSSSLDVQNNRDLNISLFNAGSKIIAAYKGIGDDITIYEYAFSAGSVPSPAMLPSYEVKSLKNFYFTYDDINHKLKVVYTLASNSNVYGDTISFFQNALKVNSPVVLNQSHHSCARPYIKRTPVIVDGSDKYHNFVVAWETSSNGTYFNVFDSNYSQISSEQSVNPDDDRSVKPRIICTDNQIAIIIDAQKYESQSLSSSGVLYYVAQRTDV